MQHLKVEQGSMRHCTDQWLSRLGHRTYLNIELGYAGECVCDIGEGGGGGGRVVVGEPQGGWGRRMPAGAERERERGVMPHPATHSVLTWGWVALGRETCLHGSPQPQLCSTCCVSDTVQTTS